MNVWAIADLHLSFSRPERRERFAVRWKDHAAKIEGLWREAIQPADLVLLPGDLSMARNHRELQPDFAWIDSLPGTKVLSPGNHDGWWNDVERIRPMLRESMHAVQGEAIRVDGLVICGARGFLPLTEDVTPEQQSALDCGLQELGKALDAAERLRVRPSDPVYLLWHYPPFDRYGRAGPLVNCLERGGVSVCVYGHLHTEGQWSRTVQGRVRGVRYYCVAADAIGFRPLRIDSW
jgi:predicted phosphohydrolase